MFSFLIETFILGLRNLRLHKLRSLLTALGIIIGVAAVITMVAIGEGGKKQAIEQMNQLGATNLVIRSVKPPESSDANKQQQRVLTYGLTRDDLQRLETLPNIVKIVPLRDTEQNVVVEGVRGVANAIGTTAQLFDVINLRLAQGRYFTNVDVDNSAAVCVMGAAAARQLFPYEDPIGQSVSIGTSQSGLVMMIVVGVLEPVGLRGEGAAMINRDLDQDIYFPLTLAQKVWGDSITKRLSGAFERKQIQLSEIWIQTDQTSDVEPLAGMADNVVSQFHTGSRDFDVKAPIQILRSAEKVNRVFNIILVGIAGFALIVGGIGIMNIMLASVTERTREIGIRRALGAKRRHITLQFLIETTVISLTGGLVGIVVGTLLATLIPIITSWLSDQPYPTQIATWSVVGSFVVSGIIGVFFGLYPAIMAARMNPIDALRHE